jgi:hypothetical protein
MIGEKDMPFPTKRNQSDRRENPWRERHSLREDKQMSESPDLLTAITSQKKMDLTDNGQRI